MILEDINVDFLDSMGSDLTVVNCARVSMSKEHKEFDKMSDVKLLNYLARNGHWSPFSHVFLQFRVKAPIVVARQLVKHHVGVSWNEVSRRYIDNEPTFYLPSMRARAENVKQGSDRGTIVEGANNVLCNAYNASVNAYNELLEAGVAPEIARMALPVGSMTEWYWSASFYAFVRVLKLRLDSHAQEECSIVARQIEPFMRAKFPESMKAFFGN